MPQHAHDARLDCVTTITMNLNPCKQRSRNPCNIIESLPAVEHTCKKREAAASAPLGAYLPRQKHTRPNTAGGDTQRLLRRILPSDAATQPEYHWSAEYPSPSLITFPLGFTQHWYEQRQVEETPVAGNKSAHHTAAQTSPLHQHFTSTAFI